eukprot:SAG31_NODE_3044_length_4751_cov_29.695615_3_plen_53_part_00
MLSGERDLVFTSAPALAPPEAPVDLVAMQRAERELAEAAQVALPSDEEEDFI